MMDPTATDFLQNDQELDMDRFRQEVEQVNDDIDALRATDWDREPGSGRLSGLPITAKDNITVQGMPATAGSKILEPYEPPFTATAAQRLEDEGAAVVAKTNQDEFGFGTFSTNSAYEVPKNPHDTDRVTGGSSGGAAALTAALDEPHIALGQSTGGSISCPAAFCGVVGLTPTYGRVSRYGLIDYANSMDKIGPITRSVQDAALALEIIAGQDPRDFTTAARDVPAFSDVEPKLHDKTIGVPEQYMAYDGVDDRVRDAVWTSIKRMEDLGATVKEISLPKIAKEYALPAYYITAVAEASTNLARYCGMRYGLEDDPERTSYDDYFAEIRSEGFGEEAKRRILLGTFARQAGYRDAYYIKALKVRQLVIDEFRRGFKDVDMLAAPTMPIPAPTFDEAGDLPPAEVYAMDTLTVGPNLAGMPQLSLPTGTVDGMPIGTHLIGPQFGEKTLLEAGLAYEKHEGFIDTPEL
ncbi:MAG: amidase family protein [Candidatus Nanohaloarchaea archaeon]|nr:amidase family protein [Candidatus Nanohaloarchaea archaeon]